MPSLPWRPAFAALLARCSPARLFGAGRLSTLQACECCGCRSWEVGEWATDSDQSVRWGGSGSLCYGSSSGRVTRTCTPAQYGVSCRGPGTQGAQHQRRRRRRARSSGVGKSGRLVQVPAELDIWYRIVGKRTVVHVTRIAREIMIILAAASRQFHIIDAKPT